MKLPADAPVYGNTESILKTVCGTATGKVNSCGHDHGPMARALVDQIATAVADQIAAEKPSG